MASIKACHLLSDHNAIFHDELRTANSGNSCQDVFFHGDNIRNLPVRTLQRAEAGDANLTFDNLINLAQTSPKIDF
jgi:hypothetical protein